MQTKTVKNAQGAALGGQRPGTPLGRTLSQQQLDQFVNVVSQVRDRALVLLLRDTGLRASEAALLGRDMIEFETREPLNERSQTGTNCVTFTAAKHVQQRKHFMEPKTAEAVLLFLVTERAGDDNLALFTSKVASVLVSMNSACCFTSTVIKRRQAVVAA